MLIDSKFEHRNNGMKKVREDIVNTKHLWRTVDSFELYSCLVYKVINPML